ncbi:MAG: TetR/AcrR family transcriptional regulator [Clostridiaceae bacterium]|nr:TetR/AcrR family transcriptional regulator [Clostridiaceae bacterium]
MPKTFSDSERAYIRRRLQEEAAVCLSLYGIRKTTVDEIVRRANIPKGTFYLFYPSKELLLFDVISSMHDAFQEKLLAEIAPLKDNMDTDTLTGILFRLYRMLDDSPLQKLIAGGELELLFRKLPPEISARHADDDDFRVEELVSMVPGMRKDKIRVFSAAIRGVFITLLHKREVGEDIFDDALRVMLRGIVLQMFEGESK